MPSVYASETAQARWVAVRRVASLGLGGLSNLATTPPLTFYARRKSSNHVAESPTPTVSKPALR